MIVLNTTPIQTRFIVKLEPQFKTAHNQLTIRVYKIMQELKDNAWSDVPEYEPIAVKDIVIDASTFIDPATMQIVSPENGINALGFIATANGAQLGLTDLNSSIYEIMAAKLETYAAVNGFITPNV